MYGLLLGRLLLLLLSVVVCLTRDDEGLPWDGWVVEGACEGAREPAEEIHRVYVSRELGGGERLQAQLSEVTTFLIESQGHAKPRNLFAWCISFQTCEHAVSTVPSYMNWPCYAADPVGPSEAVTASFFPCTPSFLPPQSRASQEMHRWLGTYRAAADVPQPNRCRSSNFTCMRAHVTSTARLHDFGP